SPVPHPPRSTLFPYPTLFRSARVRALLRRGQSETPVVQGVRIDADSRRAWLGDKELHLTTKEFDLLRVLVRDAGKVVTREQIMRSEEHTSELQSRENLVCRLL